jgi:hypothetical protein
MLRRSFLLRPRGNYWTGFSWLGLSEFSLGALPLMVGTDETGVMVAAGAAAAAD